MTAVGTLPIGNDLAASVGPATDSVTAAPITDAAHAWRLLDSALAVVTSVGTGDAAGTGTRDTAGAGNVYRAAIDAAFTALCANGALYYVEQTLTRSGVQVYRSLLPKVARYRGAN